jgi:hypothetical protein
MLTTTSWLCRPGLDRTQDPETPGLCLNPTLDCLNAQFSRVRADVVKNLDAAIYFAACQVVNTHV